MTTARRLTRSHQKRLTIRYRRPWVYPQQEEFLFTDRRYSLVEATTKSGKTTGCLIWLNEKACLEGFHGWNGWWVAPIREQAKIAYDRLKRFIGPAAETFGFKFNETELSVRYPNGAKLWFKGADKPDSLYGEDVYAAVLDEASRMKEGSWHAVRTTLTATQGPIRIIGNVKGKKNWFYQLARKAQTGEPGMFYMKLTADHAVNAGVLPAEEIADAKRLLPDAVFRELYYAEATDDGSNPFGISAIRACVAKTLEPGPVKSWGGDLAKSIDWTVLVGLNARGATASFDRWQGSWDHTTQRIIRAVGMTPAMIDSTGPGDPVFEQLAKGRSNFVGYKFTSASKQQLMEGLALYIQERAAAKDRSIFAGPEDVVLNELEAFEFVYTKTGVRYSAPEGMHDDTVCALALAVEMHRQRGNMASIGGAHVDL